MPGSAVITNPAGALMQTVSNYTTYTDVDGNEIPYGRTVFPFIASEAITLGDWVAFVAATTTTPLRVEVADTADVSSVWIGVALHDAAAGEAVNVCVEGVCVCKIGTTSPAFSDYAIVGASSGNAGVVTHAGVTATTVVGTLLGIYLGPEIGTSNTAPVYVHKQ